MMWEPKRLPGRYRLSLDPEERDLLADVLSYYCLANPEGRSHDRGEGCSSAACGSGRCSVGMTGIVLRDYQAEGLDRIVAAEARGVRKQLGVAATGLGKTVMFTTLAQRRRGRALIVAHRDELIAQAVAKVLEVWPDLTITSATAEALWGIDRGDLLDKHPVAGHATSVGIVKGKANDVRAHVVVASVQTLSRDKRLAELAATWDDSSMFGRQEPFGLVIVDEAHHAAADSYRRVLTALDAGGLAAEGAPLLFGVTATPTRGDGKGLNDVFDEIVFSYDLMYGISAGYLSDVRGLRVQVKGFDVAAMRKNRGDYDQGQAGRMLDDAGAPGLIVKAWHEHAEGRPTIVFTPTVDVAHHTAAEFVGTGVTAAAIDAGTRESDRRRVLRQLKAGEISVVTNCGVLTEGFDEPRVSCIVIARPTRSHGLYAQMIGRGTRRHPGKEDCLVLDVVGASDDKDLVTISSLYGVKGKDRKTALGDGSGRLSDIVIEDRHEAERLGEIEAEELKLFEKIRHAGIAWVQAVDARWPDRTQYRRPLGRDLPVVILALCHEDGDTWNAGLLYDDGRKDVLIYDVALETAQGVAEDYVRKHSASSMLVRADAPWRAKKPSPKAKAAAGKWHLKIDPSWTAGQLADALDAHIAKIRGKKAATKKVKP